MPELPEVEVVKKSLKNVVNNLIIKDVQINDGNLRYKLTKQQINEIITPFMTKTGAVNYFLIEIKFLWILNYFLDLLALF